MEWEHEEHKEVTKNTTLCTSWSVVFFVFLKNKLCEEYFI